MGTMSRPRGNADELLIHAGRELIGEVGMASLSVRQVVARAKVNLGMFHYHFKTKDEFARRVLQEIYEDFFQKFHLEASDGATPRDRLSQAVNTLARFARDNRTLMGALMRDAAQGHRPTLKFLIANAPRHVLIVIKLIRECQKKGQIRPMPIPLAMTFLMGSTMGPLMAFGMMECGSTSVIQGFSLKLVKPYFISDGAIAKRVEMALRGMASA